MAQGEAIAILGGGSNSASGDYGAILGGRGLTFDAAADVSLGFLANLTGDFDMSIAEPGIVLFGNTDVWLANNDNSASALRFYEANATTGHIAALKN